MDIQLASRLQTNTQVYQPKQHPFLLFAVFSILKVVIWPYLKALLQKFLGKEYAVDLCLWSFLHCRWILYRLSHQGSPHVILREEISPQNKKHQLPHPFFWVQTWHFRSKWGAMFFRYMGNREDVAIVVWISLIGVFGFDLIFHFVILLIGKCSLGENTREG